MSSKGTQKSRAKIVKSEGKSKRKAVAARGLRVRPSTATPERIRRESPRDDWDDDLLKAEVGNVSPQNVAGGGDTDTEPVDTKLPDGEFWNLKSHWLGVDTAYGSISMKPGGLKPTNPSIELTDKSSSTSLRLRKSGKVFTYLGEQSDKAGLWIGISDKLPGRIVVRAGNEEGRILLNAADSSISVRAPGGYERGRLSVSDGGGSLYLWDSNGNIFARLGDAGGFGSLELGGVDQLPGRIVLRKGNFDDQIMLDAESGDILLMNADCAEEFDVADPAATPGTVLVLGSEPGRLQPSEVAYDTRVAGVVSGAGSYRPGIVLDRKGPREGRRPVALMGKVFCWAEADSAPIRPGSLLTTSAQPGCAMAVTDRVRAFGAVLGKALAGLERGRDLIPVLVTLQ